MEQKHGALVVWFVLAAGILFGSGWIAVTAQVLFWLMAFVHGVEFVVKKDVMEKAGGSLAQHFVQTMIYGFMHWKPLEDQQSAGS